jgi:hypothetical protein
MFMNMLLMSPNTGFTPVTNTYTTGSGATETIPVGASFCTTSIVGAGGSGSTQSGANFSGGGGGGYCVTGPFAVTGGNTLTYSVGVGGAGVSSGSGNAGTLSLVVSGTQVITTMSAGGGGGGTSVVGGAGGVASGGTTTNNNGIIGVHAGTGAGGNSGAGNAGIPGGGSAGNGLLSATPPGSSGQVQFAYT